VRVLLDECVPRKFKNSLTGHECQTVPEAGFSGKRNGELLSLAEAAGFDVLLTVDQGIPYQQSISGRNLALLILKTKSNQLVDLLPLVKACLRSLESIRAGNVEVVR